MRLQGFASEQDLAGIGTGYLGNYANERGFAGAVRAQQTKNAALRYLETYVIEGKMIGVSFTDFFYLQHSFVRKTVGFCSVKLRVFNRKTTARHPYFREKKSSFRKDGSAFNLPIKCSYPEKR